MELYQLRTFAAIAELGSLTQAAERLHLSQPAASAQIKLLEEEFGVALFDRRPSGLSLTRAGASLLPEIQKVLATASNVTMLAKDLSGRVTGVVRLALVATVLDKSLLRVGQLMSSIVKHHPRLDIELQHRNSRGIEAALANDELDVGIALGSKDIPGISRIPLEKVCYRIVAPGFWGPRMRKASWDELASSPWITGPEGGSHHQMLMKLFKPLRRRPDKVIESDSEPLITSLVTAGLGLGLMREDLALEAEATGNVIVVEKGRPTIFLQVLHRVGRDSDPSIRAVLDVLRELWSDKELAAERAAISAPAKREDNANGVSQARTPSAQTTSLKGKGQPLPGKGQRPTA
jgi:DNA-binding transcriptional LysR family regulator